MLYHYNPEDKEVYCEDHNAEECLRTIRLLAIDYDGARCIEEYKNLIDELAELADKGLTFMFDNKVRIEDTENEDHESYITAYNLKKFHQEENN